VAREQRTKGEDTRTSITQRSAEHNVIAGRTSTTIDNRRRDERHWDDRNAKRKLRALKKKKRIGKVNQAEISKSRRDAREVRGTGNPHRRREKNREQGRKGEFLPDARFGGATRRLRYFEGSISVF